MNSIKAMQGGDTVEDSYAQNSWFQNNSFHSAAKPLLRQAIHHLISTTLRGRAAAAAASRPNANGTSPSEYPARHHIAIADLGCSHGRNTLDCANVILSALLDSHCDSAAGQKESIDAQIQYFFSDLPSNDFNSLFQSLKPGLQEALPKTCNHDDQGQHPLPKVFTAGVPGSFYDRLFPSASLDLVTCSYALHWLSQVPRCLLDKASPAWNAGHIWISKTDPKEAVVNAYSEQSRLDLGRFLKSRAQEISSGGILFLFLFVRSNSADRKDNESHLSLEDSFEFCNTAWQELADEGVLTVEEVDMFNLPMYLAGQHEIESALKDVPELKILHKETVHDMPFAPEKGAKAAERFVRFISSIVKPSLEGYVGTAKTNEFVKRLRATVSKHEDCFDSGITHDVEIISLQRS